MTLATSGRTRSKPPRSGAGAAITSMLPRRASRRAAGGVLAPRRWDSPRARSWSGSRMSWSTSRSTRVRARSSGRARGNYAKFEEHFARLTAAEPYATAERLLELEREAAQATRQAAAYTDMTVSFSKSVSILHASIRENARRARLAGDRAGAAWWDAEVVAFEEILHQANRAGLDHVQRHAGMTRTGYHGSRVDGREPGRFEEADIIVSSWLQGTSRDGDPQDHIHNQVARIVRTRSDGKWRALDTMCLRGVLGAVQAIVATHAECVLTARYGVGWVPRLDGKGHEIGGVTPAQMDAHSSRTG